MNKKTLSIITILFLVTIIVPFIVTASSKTLFLEPARSKDVPSHAKWNSEGGYYENTMFDENNLKNTDDLLVSGVPSEDEQNKWIKENNNSNDTVDKAIIKWYKQWSSKPNLKSYFDINENDSFKYLTSLHESELPKIINKIENNNPFKYVLMQTVQFITNYKFSESIDSSDEGTKKWLENYKLIEKSK